MKQVFSTENMNEPDPLEESQLPSYMKRVTAKTQIDVMNFSSFQDFLKAVLAEKRNNRAPISLRQLSKMAGLASPSTLSMMIAKKRPATSEVSSRIADALALTGRRRKFLLALGRLDRAKNLNEKNSIKSEMIRLRSAVDETKLIERQYRFLTEWYYPIVYVMVGMTDFKEDAKWIASHLRKPVEEGDLLKALKDLEELQLLERRNGKLFQSNQALTTADDLKDAALYQYHRNMMELALEGLNLPTHEREFSGVTVQIPKSKIPQVKEKIRQFRKDLNEYLSQFSSNEEIFQFNVQLFPLTYSAINPPQGENP